MSDHRPQVATYDDILDLRDAIVHLQEDVARLDKEMPRVSVGVVPVEPAPPGTLTLLQEAAARIRNHTFPHDSDQARLIRELAGRIR